MVLIVKISWGLVFCNIKSLISATKTQKHKIPLKNIKLLFILFPYNKKSGKLLNY